MPSQIKSLVLLHLGIIFISCDRTDLEENEKDAAVVLSIDDPASIPLPHELFPDVFPSTGEASEQPSQNEDSNLPGALVSPGQSGSLMERLFGDSRLEYRPPQRGLDSRFDSRTFPRNHNTTLITTDRF